MNTSDAALDPDNPNNAGTVSIPGALLPHGERGGHFSRYDTSQGGHYGACVTLATQAFAPADLYTGPWTNVHQGLEGPYRDILTTYWQHMINHLEQESHDYKLHQLPLARIKKVMKADPEVKMISAEAPILFAKGCDIFITELTMRAWIHAEENKRRTLQRSDIASALAKSDMFDFLIDIVPREEASAHAKRPAGPGSVPHGVPAAPGAAQLGNQHGSMGHAGNHAGAAGHGMAGEYGLGNHGMAAEQDYRPNANMYPGQVQAATAAAPYGQAQPAMYGDIDGIYPSYPMQSQQAPIPPEEFE